MKFEVKVYELLGVRFFRKLVFKLEQFIHRKDRGKNINYHLAQNSLDGISAFTKYLFYNGAIHVRNIIIIAGIILVKAALFRSFRWYDVLLLLFLLKDIYCVMLQRYNYLRLEDRKERLEERRKRIVEKRAMQVRFDEFNTEDIARAKEFVYRFQKSINDGESLIIRDEDVEIIEKLSRALNIEKA